METPLIDMHVHSNCSDGTMTPGELAAYARQKGLRAIALTDHDTVLGIPDAIEAGKQYQVEIIPGIEFSTEYHSVEIHILGYTFDWKDPGFLKELKELQDSRNAKNLKTIEKMAAAGIDITYEKMLSYDPEGVWTRANFARYLLDHGYVHSVKDAFERYLGENCPCYVDRKKMPAEDAVDLIHRYGGLAVMAHPLQYKMSPEQMDTFTAFLKSHQLDGIEAMYSSHRWTDESYVRQLARKYELSITGGSDFHGSNKPDLDLGCGRGNLKIPYLLWENLKSHIPYR